MERQPERTPSPCKMDDWRKIDWKDSKADLLKVVVSPGTQPRRYVRVEMARKAFVEAFGFTDPLSLPVKRKLDKWPLQLGPPRKDQPWIEFEEIGETIRFWYIAGGGLSALNAAYSAAYAARHGG